MGILVFYKIPWTSDTPKIMLVGTLFMMNISNYRRQTNIDRNYNLINVSQLNEHALIKSLSKYN